MDGIEDEEELPPDECGPGIVGMVGIVEGIGGIDADGEPPDPPELPEELRELLWLPPPWLPLGMLELLPPLDPDEPLEPLLDPDEPPDGGELLGEGMLGDDCCSPAQPPIRKLETAPIAVIWAATTSSRCSAWLLFIAHYSRRESDECAASRTPAAFRARPRAIVRPQS